MIVFVSGHLDVSPAEFNEHYVPRLCRACAEGASFVVGDARGADEMAQVFLGDVGATVTVYHMFDEPRRLRGPFRTCGGFRDDEERDAAMTAASTVDVAWVRPGRERSGTARNIMRRRAEDGGMIQEMVVVL